MKKILMLLCILNSTNINAANWKVTGQSDNLVMEVDLASIGNLKNGQKKAWKSYLFVEPQTLIGTSQNYQKVLLLSYYNCAERTSATTQEVYYDAIEGGKVIYSISNQIQRVEFNDVVPGSFDERALETVCDFKRIKNREK